MNVLDTNYLINELESGKQTKILCMCHNAYWSQLEKINRRYKNCHMDIFGNGVSYIMMRRNFDLDNYDYILFYSNEFFSQNDYDEMKEMAFQISNHGKRVSIGYSYVIPIEERKDKDVSEEFRVFSFKDGIEREGKGFGFPFFDVIDLADSVVSFHNELEKAKVKRI